MWIDPKKEMPKTTGIWSDKDVFICRMYTITIGRTRKGKWVDMDNNLIPDVILWMPKPEIKKEHENLFNVS